MNLSQKPFSSFQQISKKNPPSWPVQKTAQNLCSQNWLNLGLLSNGRIFMGFKQDLKEESTFLSWPFNIVKVQ